MPFIIEVSAALNVAASTIAAILGAWFIRHLWGDVLQHRDIGSIGFMMIFITAFLFNIWDAAIYTILVVNHSNTSLVLPLTTLKPGIHAVEIFAYLLLYLHFRK